MESKTTKFFKTVYGKTHEPTSLDYQLIIVSGFSYLCDQNGITFSVPLNQFNLENSINKN